MKIMQELRHVRFSNVKDIDFEMSLKNSLSMVDYCLLIFITVLIPFLLLKFPITIHTWDSLSISQQIESGILYFSVDHAFPEFVFFCLFKLQNLLGLSCRALDLLLFFNALISAVAVCCFYLIARNIGLNRWVAFSFSIILFSSYAYWYFSSNAEVYIFVVLTQLFVWLAFQSFLRNPSNKNLYLIGFSVAVSILSHRANVILFACVFVGLLFMVKFRMIPIRFVLYFTAVAWIIVVGGAILLASICNIHSIQDMIQWSVGYLSSDNIKTGFRGTGGILSRIQDPLFIFFLASGAIIEGFKDPVHYSIRVFYLVIFVFVFFSSAFIWLRSQNKKLSILFLALMCQIVLGVLAAWWWEPESQKYWLLVLASFFIIVAMSASYFLSIIKLYLLKLCLIPFCIVFLLFTFQSSIWKRHTEPNWPLQATFSWSETAEPEDLIIEGSGFTPFLRYYGRFTNVIYIPQFLHRYTDAKHASLLLEQRINDAFNSGQRVFFTSDVETFPNSYSKEMTDFWGVVVKEVLSSCASEEIRKYKFDTDQDVIIYEITKNSCDFK